MPQILERWEVQPHERLEELELGLLTVVGEIRMPLGNFPRRMSVVALAGGRTAIFSAIALDEPEMARIEKMGRPAVLIVPGDQHRLDARIWKQRYPDLRVLAPPGARPAVAEIVPVDTADPAAAQVLLNDSTVRFLVVPGTGGHEAALEVRRGRRLTVICNDVIGNVAHPHGIGARIMGRLMGFGLSAPQIPRLIRHKIVEDRAALAGQFRAWAAEPDLRRLIVSHGDVIEQDPAAVLRALADTLES
jgi:hypothetical protein